MSVLILVGFVVFAGYMVFGVTGFGASPITIPVLVHLLPLTFVLALAAILDLSSALVLGARTRQQADARELAALVPFTLVGLTLGVTLLVHLPWNTLFALGLFVCVFAPYVMFRRDAGATTEPGLGSAHGHRRGIIGAPFGMEGPLCVMYITGRVGEPAAQRDDCSDGDPERWLARAGVHPGWPARLSRALGRGGDPPPGRVGRGVGRPSRARAPGARGDRPHHRRRAVHHRRHPHHPHGLKM